MVVISPHVLFLLIQHRFFLFLVFTCVYEDWVHSYRLFTKIHVRLQLEKDGAIRFEFRVDGQEGEDPLSSDGLEFYVDGIPSMTMDSYEVQCSSM
mgnify:CR=1 FL=1